MAHGRARPRVLLALAVAVAGVLMLSAAPGAYAAVGDISGMSCISKAGTGGCSALPEPNILASPAGVVVAPDGTDVYVGSNFGVAHFRRAADGALTYASCIDTSSGIGDGCPVTSAPADGNSALNFNAIQVAISPDGRFVYAVAYADALVWFSRNTSTGVLAWGGCRDGASDSSTNGRCGAATTFGGGNFPAGSIAFPQGIAITPDGGTLYIADQQEGLLQAQINTSTGVPTPTACFNTTGSQATGCTAIASGIPMAGVGLAIASNDRDIYLSSVSPGGVTHFQRTGGASTAFSSCIVANSPSGTCLTAAANPVFINPGAIAVSGNYVFTHGGNFGIPDGTLGKFARDTDGSLDLVNCATTVAAAGPCATMPAGTLSGNIGRLMVSPNGSSVYTRQSGSPSALARLTGELAFGSCIGIGVAACAAPPLPAPFAAATGGSAFSPDGKQIYQAAADQLNTFAVATVDTPPPGSIADPMTAKPVIKSVSRVRKGRHRGKYRVKIGVLQAGALTAKFEGRLRRGAKIRSLSKTVRRKASRLTTYTLYLKPSAAARKRKLRAGLVVTLTAPGHFSARVRKSVRLR